MHGDFVTRHEAPPHQRSWQVIWDRRDGAAAQPAMAAAAAHTQSRPNVESSEDVRNCFASLAFGPQQDGQSAFGGKESGRLVQLARSS